MTDNRLRNYTSFSVFERKVDLKRRNIFISFEEICNLFIPERRQACTIACLYLSANTTPNINSNVKRRKLKRLRMKKSVKSLAPFESTEILGKNLGKYFLLDIY